MMPIWVNAVLLIIWVFIAAYEIAQYIATFDDNDKKAANGHLMWVAASAFMIISNMYFFLLKLHA